MSLHDRPRLWWRCEGDAIAVAMKAHVDDLRLLGAYNGVSRREELAAWRAMYLDRPAPGRQQDLIGRHARSPFNLTQGGVDSTHAKITTTRPRPQILSVGGRWKQQRKAKLLQRWVDGEYQRLKAYKLLANLVHDSEVYGTGWLKVYGACGRVRLERVWDGDIFLDPREERFGTVRTMYQVAAVDRDALIERFPEMEQEINAAPPAALDDVMPFDDLQVSVSTSLDLVAVLEGWRLGPSESTPGKHALAISTGLLFEEDWDRPGFPFVRYAWGRDPERVRGQGLVERGAGVQMDIDEHSTVVKDAYDKFVPRWAVPSEANISTKALNDGFNAIVYEGLQPPTVLAPPAVSPDFLNREESLAQRYYRVTGIGEMEAQSMTPANLSSGKAIMAHQDATSLRFLQQGRDYEDASVELAELVLATADDLAEDEESAQEVYGTDNGAELLRYKDARMDQGSYVVRVFPASKLPDTIAGRQETIGILMDRQIITDPAVARDLMDLPDLERHQDLASAKRQAAEKEIDRCLDGEQGIPSSYMDLPYAVDRATLELNNALVAGGEEDDPDAMDMLRAFISAALALRDQPPEPPPQAAPPPEPPPGAAADPMADMEMGGMPGEGMPMPMEPAA